jgi:hypothetical protein
MTQAPIFGSIGAGGVALVTRGGKFSVLSISAPMVLKAGPGRACKIIVQTAGSVTLNDSATLAGASAANVIYTNATDTAAATIEIDFPFTSGLVVSAITGIVNISYA